MSSYYIYSVLNAMADLNINDIETIDKIVNKYRHRNNQYIRSALYLLLTRSGFVDEHIDVFIKGLYIERQQLKEDRESVILMGEWSELKKGLKSATSSSSIKAILRFYEDKDGSSYHGYNDDSEVFKIVMDNAFHAYKQDSSIYDIVYKLYKSYIEEYYGKYIESIISFFERTNNLYNVFRAVWNETHEDYYKRVLLLSGIISESVIVSFINGYVNHDYTNNDIEKFYRIIVLNYGKKPLGLVEFFKEQVKVKTTVVLPKLQFDDQSDLQTSKNQRSFDLLFDKLAMQNEVNNIFLKSGRENLDSQDLWNINRTDKDKWMENVPLSALDLVRKFTYRKNVASKEIITEWFQDEKKFERYQIKEIYNELKNKEALAISQMQIAFIKAWCNKVANYDSIANAIKTKDNYRSFSIDENVIMLWYFIRKFNYRMPESIMLGFTVFKDFTRRNDENIKSEIVELEQFVNKKVIEDKVIDNLRENITGDQIWKDNAMYAIDHGLVSAYSYIIRDIKDSVKFKYYRSDVLKAFFTKTKDYATLQGLLSELKDDSLSWTIVDLLIKEKEVSKSFKEYLSSRMRDEHETLDDRLLAAKYLTMMNDINGLIFYADYIIQRNDPSIEYTSLSRWFSKINTREAIPILLELLKLSKQPDFRIDTFNQLDSLVLDTLHSISMASEGNLYEVKKALIDFIEANQKVFPDLKYLPLTIDKWEQQYYLDKSKSITLEQAIEDYQQLN